MPLVSFYTPWKQNTGDFMAFLGSMERQVAWNGLNSRELNICEILVSMFFFLKTDGGSYSPAWDVAVKWLLNEELEMFFKIRLFHTKVKLNFLSQIKSWVSSLLSRQLLFNGTSGTRNSKPGQIWQSMESQMESLIQDYYLVFQ